MPFWRTVLWQANMKHAKEKKKGKKSVKFKVLAGILIFLLVFAVGSFIMTKMVYDGNFERGEVSAYSAYLRYADVETEYPRSTVQFPSGKNMLTGYLYGEENEKGLVVIAHGLGGGAESYMAETMVLVDGGWRVFAYDATGSAASEGESTKGLPQQALDLTAALTYIGNDPWLASLPLMLYGHSWGGYAVTAVLKQDFPVLAAVSVAGFNSPTELLVEQAVSMMGFFAYVEYPFLWGYQSLLFGSTAWDTAVQGINQSNAAVLIAHGTADEAIQYNGAGIIAHRDEITNPNVQYLVFEEEGRNGHNNLVMSEAAAAYATEKNKEYKVIFDQYNGEVPDEVKAEYYAGVDKPLASQLDETWVRTVNEFYEKALASG